MTPIDPDDLLAATVEAFLWSGDDVWQWTGMSGHSRLHQRAGHRSLVVDCHLLIDALQHARA